MTFDTSVFSSFVLVGTGFAAAFLLALWISLIIWTFRDIRRRSRDPLVRVLAVLVVAILFLPGVLIYLLLRPSHTVEDEYQQTLEEEALLQSIEDVPLCPGCGRHIQADWVVCPDCHTRLKKVCRQCGKLMELSWNLCPYCATPAPGMRAENSVVDDAVQDLPNEEKHGSLL
ncbi:MAG TPA: zinc ribbon domain-containing protein [Longilinea sp.]|nr:zinc ribbon domain-containing protein [Longilinea sp.]